MLVAAIVSLLYAVFVLLMFRRKRFERRAAFMLVVYFGSLPVLLLLLAYIPADFWILPESLIERNPVLDWGFAVFTFSASVFGGWLQLYNLADRGLSLRILIDALESKNGRVNIASIEASYGAGRGIQWMYSKRLADVERLGLMSRDGADFVLTSKGFRNARLVKRLRSIYSLSLTREL